MALGTEEKRTILRRMSAEVFDGGEIDVVDELVSPDFVDHDPLPGLPANREGLKQAVLTFRSAFPDFAVEVVNTLVDGDRVIDHTRASGTHAGEFLGIPATGRRVSASAIVLSRLGEDGRIAERWQCFNGLQLLQQLGAVPGWEEPPPAPEPPAVADGAATSPEENKALYVRHLEEIWNRRRYEVADELFHPQAVAPDAPQLPPGPEGCKVAARMFHAAFPDFHAEVDDLVAERDLVCARLTQRGTHRGELFGVPPTGRSVEFRELAIVKLAGGRIVCSWFQTDVLGLMAQLGVGAPSGGQTP
jgi:steroid delta-isomerase-like uncharacterized protein